MLQVLLNGGWIVWPILLCSMAVLAISIERFWVLRRKLVTPPGLMTRFRDFKELEKLDAGQLQTLAAASVQGEILIGLFERRGQSEEQVHEYLETAGRAASHRLGNNLATLGVVAAIAPLLGLLGTVIGMIKVFSSLMAGGIGDVDALAGGIGEALVTTALGIGVAIPAHLLYAWFSRRVEYLTLVLEKDSVDCLDQLAKHRASQQEAR